MFYEPRKKNHGLPHNPINAIVAPRPIGWISTISVTGDLNVAPYSYFNLVSYDPPVVMFAGDPWKHSVVNAEATGQFVCNIATLDLLGKMVLTSATLAAGESEFELAELDAAPSTLVKPPRVAAAPCALECEWTETIRIRDRHGEYLQRPLVLGEVIGVHINDEFIDQGRVRADWMRIVGRCGYLGDYAAIERFYVQERPAGSKGGG
jgi:flavin reductase (DIM6/NTAB) family NADH-FMN oxidoreductase RutF